MWSDLLQLHLNNQGSGGVRLLALKFVEAVILLYTPDPNGSLKPSSDEGNAFHSFLFRLCLIGKMSMPI